MLIGRENLYKDFKRLSRTEAEKFIFPPILFQTNRSMDKKLNVLYCRILYNTSNLKLLEAQLLCNKINVTDSLPHSRDV